MGDWAKLSSRSSLAAMAGPSGTEPEPGTEQGPLGAQAEVPGAVATGLGKGAVLPAGGNQPARVARASRHGFSDPREAVMFCRAERRLEEEARLLAGRSDEPEYPDY